ncbi:hypothetical protein ENBRE01_2170 [Enteropsectra breve]|nr:hypothetical protein ENBRE01_2170 [Enteropsectra breve]
MGWKRNSTRGNNGNIRQIAREEMENSDEEIKTDSFYIINTLKSANQNCFWQNCYFNGNLIRVLIDTGADISIVPKSWIKNETKMRKAEITVKSVCGEQIEIIGRMEQTSIQLCGYRIAIEPYVSTNEPNDYMILGADSLIQNPRAASKVLKGCLEGDNIRPVRSNKMEMIREISDDSALNKFSHLFKTEIDVLCKAKAGSHRIITENVLPVAQRNIQIPRHWENELNTEIMMLERTGVIRKSKSPWVSRIVPVKKKSGEIRLCIDFRGLNAVTKKDSYPIPRIDEIIDELQGATIFTTLDATKGYYQIEIAEEDKEKTGFRWKENLFEFNRMPFGLCNAPATFQRTMNSMFEGILGKFVRPYLDDIIIFSKTEEEHRMHLEIVAERLSEANISLNKNKCKFNQKEIEILGNVITGDEVRPSEDKVKAINNYPMPQTIRELRSFLGLINYCRSFIPNIASIIGPLNNLLKGETKKSIKKIVWDETTKRSFLTSRKTLSMNTLKTQPDFSKKFILTTDASENAIGAILSQEDENGKERMVSAYSKLLDDTQKHYSVTDKELLAIVKATEHYRRYLLGKTFLVKTDHKALSYLHTAKNPTSRMLRWSLKLQEFDYEIQYIQGEANGADGLSRIRRVETKKNYSREETLEIMKEYHMKSGHGSAKTMQFLIEDKYEWENIKKDLEEYVRKCPICSIAGGKRINTKNRVMETDRPGELWECDLIGRLPGKDGSSKFIFTAVDHYDKWVEAAVIQTKDKASVARCIMELIIKKHGVPGKILTDNGREFDNDLCKKLAQEYEIEWLFSSADHHQTVGCVERMNQTLFRKIKKLCEFGKYSWERMVKAAAYAVNISPTRSTGTSPYVFRKGMTPALPIDLKHGITTRNVDTEDCRTKRKIIKEKYNKEIEKGKIQTNVNFIKGDRVLIYRDLPKEKLGTKWERNNYKVVELAGIDAYKVCNGNQTFILNKTQIKKDYAELNDGGVGV